MRDWHHAPPHRLDAPGVFFVTCGTHERAHVFRRPPRLDFLVDTFLSLAEKEEWELEAWVFFSNHYHFIARSPSEAEGLAAMLRAFHSVTAIEANRWDATPDRQVWFQYRDTRLTFERSYLARLNYVHQNAVHHGLVREATQYPWCSAGWFERNADRSFFRTVTSFKIDRLNVFDEYQPILEDSE